MTTFSTVIRFGFVFKNNDFSLFSLFFYFCSRLKEMTMQYRLENYYFQVANKIHDFHGWGAAALI